MYQIQFRLGLRPDPRWGPTSKGRGGRGKGKGREGRGEGRGEGKGEETRPQPFTPPLIHVSGYAPERCNYILVLCTCNVHSYYDNPSRISVQVARHATIQ